MMQQAPWWKWVVGIAIFLCSVNGWGQTTKKTEPAGDLSEVFLSLKGRERPLSVAVMPIGGDHPSDDIQNRLARQIYVQLIEDLRNSVRLEAVTDSMRIEAMKDSIRLKAATDSARLNAGADSVRTKALIDSVPSNVETRAQLLTRWAAWGARAVLDGEMRGEGSEQTFFCRLFRLPDGRPLIVRSYPVQEGNVRKVVHRISDDVVLSLTGQRGIASTQMTFVSGRGGNKGIYIMDADGQNIRSLTRDTAIYLSPDWSPDGKRLVYSKLSQGKWELSIVDLASGVHSPLRTSSSMNTAPAWSPDGTSVLFALNEMANIDLYAIRVSGFGIQRITDHPEVDTEPCWSPDGSRIAFTSDRTGMPQVYLMDRNGSGLRRLTWEPDSYEGSPVWSPDGSRIAFVRRGFEGFDVYVMGVSGGTPVRLTDQGSNENPSWSPDGLQIAFSSNRDKGYDIYVMNWDGTNVRRLTFGGDTILPSWSPFMDQGGGGK